MSEWWVETPIFQSMSALTEFLLCMMLRIFSSIMVSCVLLFRYQPDFLGIQAQGFYAAGLSAIALSQIIALGTIGEQVVLRRGGPDGDDGGEAPGGPGPFRPPVSSSSSGGSLLNLPSSDEVNNLFDLEMLIGYSDCGSC